MKTEKYTCSYCNEIHDYEHDTVCDNSLKPLPYKYTISEDAFPAYSNTDNEKILRELIAANNQIAELKRENDLLSFVNKKANERFYNTNAKNKERETNHKKCLWLLDDIMRKQKVNSVLYKQIAKLLK